MESNIWSSEKISHEQDLLKEYKFALCYPVNPPIATTRNVPSFSIFSETTVAIKPGDSEGSGTV
jgi:hypothetical protein